MQYVAYRMQDDGKIAQMIKPLYTIYYIQYTDFHSSSL